MDNLQDIPEAQRIDYASAQPRKRFPWLLLFASPFLSIGAGFATCGLLVVVQGLTPAAVYAAIGTGFLVFGGMLVLIHLRWK